MARAIILPAKLEVAEVVGVNIGVAVGLSSGTWGGGGGGGGQGGSFPPQRRD